jgi:hypothetical protein
MAEAELSFTRVFSDCLFFYGKHSRACGQPIKSFLSGRKTIKFCWHTNHPHLANHRPSLPLILIGSSRGGYVRQLLGLSRRLGARVTNICRFFSSAGVSSGINHYLVEIAHSLTPVLPCTYPATAKKSLCSFSFPFPR